MVKPCLGITLTTAPQAGTHGLQILNAQKEDAGQYTCMVTNELGEATKNYHVEVLSEPPTISGTVADQAKTSWPHMRPQAPSCGYFPWESQAAGRMGSGGGRGGKTLALVILKGRDSVKTLVLVIQILPQFRLPTTTSGVEMQLGVPQFGTWVL